MIFKIVGGPGKLLEIVKVLLHFLHHLKSNLDIKNEHLN